MKKLKNFEKVEATSRRDLHCYADNAFAIEVEGLRLDYEHTEGVRFSMSAFLRMLITRGMIQVRKQMSNHGVAVTDAH